MDFNTLVNSIKSAEVRRRILGELTVIRHVVEGLHNMGFSYVEYHDEEGGEYTNTLGWDGHNGLLDCLMAMDEETVVVSKDQAQGHSAVTFYFVYGNEPCEVICDYGYSGVTVEEREAIDALIQDVSDRIETGELPHMKWTDLAKPFAQPVKRVSDQYWFVDVHVSMVKTFCVKASTSDEAWQEGREELRAWSADGYPIDGWEILTGSEDVNDVSRMPDVNTAGIAP